MFSFLFSEKRWVTSIRFELLKNEKNDTIVFLKRLFFYNESEFYDNQFNFFFQEDKFINVDFIFFSREKTIFFKNDRIVFYFRRFLKNVKFIHPQEFI